MSEASVRFSKSLSAKKTFKGGTAVHSSTSDKSVPAQTPSPRSGDNKNSIHNKAIIQCPACNTKFALDKGLFDQQDCPRFHCSRCDNVFSLQTELKQDTQQKNSLENKIEERKEKRKIEKRIEQATEKQLEQNVEHNLENFSENKPSVTSTTFQGLAEDLSNELGLNQSVNQGVELIPNPNAPIAPILSALSNNQSDTDLQPESQITERSRAERPKTHRSQALRVPNQLDLSLDPYAPHENNNTEHTGGTTPLRAKLSQLGAAKDSTLQTAFDFNAKPSADTLELPRFSSSIAERYSKSSSAPLRSDRPDLNDDSKQPSFSTSANLRLGSLVKNNPLGLISAPIVFLLAILALFTVFSRQFPIEAHSLLSSIFPNSPKVAPSGLNIEEPNFRRVILESGESVSLISGRILNNTSERFSEIQIEGQAFNNAGRLVSSATSSSATALARTRIKSLTPEMIDSIQSEKRSFSLNPGEEQSFTIALIDNDVSNASYFAARIFSVRGERS